jgi:hypothetical protein
MAATSSSTAKDLHCLGFWMNYRNKTFFILKLDDLLKYVMKFDPTRGQWIKHPTPIHSGVIGCSGRFVHASVQSVGVLANLFAH